MKTPNSKSEFRNPKWFDFAHHPEPVEGQIPNSNDPMFKTFEFRISDLFRASDLGFRISEPLKNARGSYLVLLALMTMIFAGVGGMIFELHKSMALRTHLQNVADMAALAAAREYHDTKGEITFTRINAIIEKVAKENAHWLGKNLYYAPDLSLAEGNMMGYFRGSPLTEDEKGNWNDYEFTPFTTPHSNADAEIGGMITTVPNTQVNAVRAVLRTDAKFTEQMLEVFGFEGELRAESIAQVCPDGSVALYGMCEGDPPRCNINGVQDGDEKGVDCGGTLCPKCPGRCGDGHPDPGLEECDLGDGVNGTECPDPAYSNPASSCTYCSIGCTWVTKTGPECGDGIKNGPEECEPKNTATCDDKCQGIDPVCRWVTVSTTLGAGGSAAIELEVDPASGATQYYKKTLSGSAGQSFTNHNLFCIAMTSSVERAAAVPAASVDFVPTTIDCGVCDEVPPSICCPIEGCEEPKVTDKEGRTELQKDPNLT